MEKNKTEVTKSVLTNHEYLLNELDLRMKKLTFELKNYQLIDSNYQKLLETLKAYYQIYLFILGKHNKPFILRYTSVDTVKSLLAINNKKKK